MPLKRPPDSLGRSLTPGSDKVEVKTGVAQPAAASLAMPLKRPPDSLARPLNHGRDTVEVKTGCGAAWLARLSGGQEVPGSNPGTPTGISPSQSSKTAVLVPPSPHAFGRRP